LPDNSALLLLDQRRLPEEEYYERITDWREAAEAIRAMVVRGAPAIGITAAYAMVLAALRSKNDYIQDMRQALEGLSSTRPTAVNLNWALKRVMTLVKQHPVLPHAERVEQLAELCREIHRQDVADNRRMGRYGAELLPDGGTVLTHCNAGALATGGYGTALGVIRAAREQGKKLKVVVDETRPYLQGTRLTAWELARDGFDVTLIADSAAGSLFAQGRIDCVVVGSDRIARNGDVANKIGTYPVACLAGLHERPFYVAAPTSTLDLATSSGRHIPIEQRSPDELTRLGARRVAPPVLVENPAFDVTPARLVTAIITENGVARPVSETTLRGVAKAVE
jgi:methylthioribose-1-phosphate isomerase